jgi:hypothetical protein
LPGRIEGDLRKRKYHGEDHPYVDHLDVGRGWKAAGDANETENYLLENR